MKRWEPWEEELLLGEYPKGNVEAIVKATGKNRKAVIQKAFRMGIKQDFIWTAEEEEFLDENVGIYSMEVIAKKLGRSRDSVHSKCSKMGLSFATCTEYIHVSELARIMKQDRHNLTRKLKNRGVRFRKKGGFTVITMDRLCKFLKENPDFYDATEIDDSMFRGMPWFEKKRAADAEAKRERRWRGVI